MRRKKNRGVYTNRTMKVCQCCAYFCTICKGVCKIEVIADIDPDSIADNHPLSDRKKKQHHFGVGSLKRGRVFAPITNHRDNSWGYNNSFENRHLKKAYIAVYIRDQLEYYELIKYSDS
jgi:hypothetical protein